MGKIIFLFAELTFLAFKNQAQTVTDYDGNVYHTVTIGKQTWMKENLKVTHYSEGGLINTTTPVTLDISKDSMPKYQWAYNGDAKNIAVYGRLYTWYAVTDSQKICPIGWHVPTDAEWTTLTTYLGGQRTAGGKLKDTGITHWNSPNTGATNEKGFTALSGGYRGGFGSFYDMGISGYWWSRTGFVTPIAWYRLMNYNDGNVSRSSSGKTLGLSVRCLRD
jgi:uncharacterized protein (TIGR02145 family)